MTWLNYQHLFYFWTVMRKGSIVEACRVLRLAPSTVSAQVHSLESTLGHKLLVRNRGDIRPTKMGAMVLAYADNIFALGNELLQKVQAGGMPVLRELRVGVVDALPKQVARWLIEPALHLPEKVRVVCRESSPERLFHHLVTGDLDVVLADAPPDTSAGLLSHLIIESDISFVATSKLAAAYKKDFPRSFHRAPFLLPASRTSVRRNLDSWFESEGIEPDVAGEFEDHAMLRAFIGSGLGIVPVPSCVEQQFLTRRVRKVGQLSSVRACYYAITTKKNLERAPVAAICHRPAVAMLDSSG